LNRRKDVREKIVKFNFIIIIFLVICLAAGFGGSFFAGAAFGKQRTAGHLGRDHEYSRQMGRASELLESIDGNLGGIQDGLGRIKIYLGQDAGDLRRLAERLRVIAGEIAEMENNLVSVRSGIGYFRGHYNYFNHSLMNDNSER